MNQFISLCNHDTVDKAAMFKVSNNEGFSDRKWIVDDVFKMADMWRWCGWNIREDWYNPREYNGDDDDHIIREVSEGPRRKMKDN